MSLFLITSKTYRYVITSIKKAKAPQFSIKKKGMQLPTQPIKYKTNTYVIVKNTSYTLTITLLSFSIVRGLFIYPEQSPLPLALFIS